MALSFPDALQAAVLEDWPAFALGLTLVGLSALADVGWPGVAGAGTAMIAMSALEATRKAAGFRRYVTGAIVGTTVASACAYRSLIGSDRLLLVFVPLGAWLALDACYAWRYGVDEPDALAERLVLSTLREASSPRRPAYVAERTGLSADAVERLLEEAAAGGAVYRVGTRYAADDSSPGPLARRWERVPARLRLYSGR